MKSAVNNRFVEVIEALVKSKKVKNKVDFATQVGVNQSRISEIAKNKYSPSMEIQKMLRDLYNVDLNWLITGDGNMFDRHKLPNFDYTDSNVVSEPPIDYNKGIPLMPLDAWAGMTNTAGYTIKEDMIEERYIVPLFNGKGVDFLIPVRGSSMYPKYNSGDVVACRFIKELLFIQWNKVYIIDSISQGAMIKRLIDSGASDTVICRSDNKDYADFVIPRSDIQNIALVVGVIRLE